MFIEQTTRVETSHHYGESNRLQRNTKQNEKKYSSDACQGLEKVTDQDDNLIKALMFKELANNDAHDQGDDIL